MRHAGKGKKRKLEAANQAADSNSDSDSEKSETVTETDREDGAGKPPMCCHPSTTDDQCNTCRRTNVSAGQAGPAVFELCRRPPDAPTPGGSSGSSGGASAAGGMVPKQLKFKDMSPNTEQIVEHMQT